MRDKGPSQIQFWFIALAIGIAAGFAALFFRKGIEVLQRTLYGVDDVRMMQTFAEGLPWFLIFIIPICGGLVVGLILHWFTPDGRVRSVADVIEGAALSNGRVEEKAAHRSGPRACRLTTTARTAAVQRGLAMSAIPAPIRV
ncbi:MAG: hypothetical protein AAF376_13240, partial [Pseudomonadota bacterium]